MCRVNKSLDVARRQIVDKVCIPHENHRTRIAKSVRHNIGIFIFSLLHRLQESENPLVVNYFYTVVHFTSPMFKYWDNVHVSSYAIFIINILIYLLLTQHFILYLLS